ncbi:cell wall-binding repeat-containing protein [Ornithinimicrobium avium]|uniref:Cell wall-binding repeat-containing protein n=1 Tax=Ornithinimicrobium avium TaxID=2283195 RepID=A0A345NL79_9MICO|nr:cell wall-binding repeat-containing protein [Ornithinimicrobium avium]AXH95787.1 cell wall-binding repeat-containing protein [Ornithinimicrobium avium]
MNDLHAGTTVRARRRTAAVAALATATVGVVGAVPARAATLGDYDITGVQFVNGDCSRNEYVVKGSVTGDTDDGGGFDKIRVQVWDDGILKDARDTEVAVGTTMDVTAFLSFVGLYGTGAPGVGIEIVDIDGSGDPVATLSSDDPFFPEDVDGPCSFDIERIGGADRIETAALLSQQKFVAADTVLIASSRAFPDALAAAPWAAQLGAPLLLSRPGGLSAVATAELTRLQPSRVIVVGGPTALGQDVLDDVQAALPTAVVDRVGGADRYATAGMVASQVVQDSSAEVFVASGQDFPDALVLSALAARHQAPLVLTRGTSLPAATATALAGLSYDALYAAGGPTVLSDDVLDAAADGVPVTRYAGDDRYGTAEQVLEQFPAEGKVMVASGQAFPDALTSVPVAARTGAGVALTRPAAVPAGIMDEIDRLISSTPYPLITIVGGTTAVNPSVETQLQTLFGSSPAPAQRPQGTQTDSNVPATR